MRVKSSLCCRYTTTPSLVARTVSVAVVYSSLALLSSIESSSEIVREGVEPSFPLYRNGVLDHWTTGLCVEAVGLRPEARGRGSRLFCLAHLLQPYASRLNDPCGIRTLPGRLERPATSPEVERAVREKVRISASSIRTGDGPRIIVVKLREVCTRAC